MIFNRAPKLSLLALGLLAALSVSAPMAVAAGNERAKSVAKASKPASISHKSPKAATAVAAPAEESACACQPSHTSYPNPYPYRTDSLPVTPQIEAIFKAASTVDEASFTALLAHIPDINRYLLEDDTLLAVLLRPNLPKAQAGEQDPNDYGEMSDSTRQRLLAAHQALLPARTRMLALLLKAGARPGEFTRSSSPALHLALLFGTPEIVDLLLQAGADPDQPDFYDKESPIEYALKSDFAIRRSGMPDLVSRSDRSAMFLALLKAGAHRPFATKDATLQKSMGEQAQYAFNKAKTPQAKAKSLSDLAKAPHLVAADYELWAPLVEMTEGTAVLDAFARMGTSPRAVDGDENLFSHAAFAGNADALAWLQKHLPRYYDEAAFKNLDEEGNAQATPPTPPQRDAWGEAAAWALETPFTAQRPAIFKLLGREDTDWAGSANWASRASERVEKTYLSRLYAHNSTPLFGSSLLVRVVATGDAALLEIALSLNAVRSSDAAFEAQKSKRKSFDDAGSASGDALVQALLMQRADLLQRLLTAGASPLAWATDQTTPLAVSANGKAADRYGDKKPLSAQDRTFYAATFDSFLKQLTPEQIRAGDTPERTPLKDAFDFGSDTQDWGLVNKLVAAGFSPGKLPLSYLEKAIINDRNVLALAMLDGGIASQSSTVLTQVDYLTDSNEDFSNAIRWAAFNARREVLDRLLALRRPSATLSTAELGIMIWLLDLGRVDAIKLLQSRGWVVDRTLNQPALNSMRPAVIDFVLKTTSSTLAGLCIPADTTFGWPPLTDAIYLRDDATWQQLLALGVARLPGCAAQPSEDRIAPVAGREAAVDKTPVPLPMTALANDVLSDPFALVGFSKERLPARIAQLRQHGMQKADFGDSGAGSILRKAAGETALQPLLAALEAPLPAKALAGAAASHPARLVGSYRLDASGGTDVNLQLKADGRFEWSRIFGAFDRYAQGQWHEAGGKVVFASDPTPPFNWFKVTAQTQYADGPDTGQPLTLLVDVSKNRVLKSIQIVVEASADETWWLHVKPNVESTFTLKGQPRSAALWFPEMKTILASEVALPDLPRLKSVTLTLQLPQQAVAMAFNEVMRADAEGLHMGAGDSVYKKLE